MGYVEQSLIGGEQVILKAKLHWAMFISPALNIGVGLILIIASLSSKDASSIACIAWPVFLLGLLNAISTVISYFTTEFALTNKRIIAKTGLIRRISLELMLTKVESINVDEPILGRIFNYGTISVVGSGGTKGHFKNIANALELRKQINTSLPTA